MGGRDYDIVTSPVFNEKGEHLGTAAQWNDITEQLAAEKEIAGIVEAAAAGDFRKRISEADKTGFMLQMSHGLNEVLSTSESALSEIARILKALADGDLTQKIEAGFQGVFAELKDDSNGTIERLRDIIRQIRETAESINTAAGEIATGNNALSRRTEEEASSLEETASSMEELAATVKRNAENAGQASKLAGEASESAARGGEVVSRAVGTMKRDHGKKSRNRRHHDAHRRHRVPDQHPGAERRGGGSPGWRAGPRLRRGCLRGAQPRKTQRRSRKEHQSAHREHGGQGR